MVISVLLISSEKITEARLCLIAADRTMSSPSVDFPIAGLAARTIIWPGCSPFVSESRSVNPVGTPVISPDLPDATSISSTVISRMSPRRW